MKPRPDETMLASITPLVITFNEAPNIERTLARLLWARRIVVVDSGSTDATLAILARHPQVEVHTRPFDTFANQCNFGLTQIASEWVLSLDADYELSDALVGELQALRPDAGVAGYSARFVYRVHGRALRGTLYPPRTVLYRRAAARYHDEGHGHRVCVDGAVGALRGVIYHDDRKPLARWFRSQQRYAEREAEHLLACAPAGLGLTDRLRRLAFPAPLLVLPYVLLVKGCLFDGWPGWLYGLQRLIAECMIALEILDRRLARTE